MSTMTDLAVRMGATTSLDATTAAAELFAQLQQEGTDLVLVYCSSDYDLPTLARELRRHFGEVPLVGCTTAGEISPLGYLRGSLSGVSIAGGDIKVVTERIDSVSRATVQEVYECARNVLRRMGAEGVTPRRDDTFAYMLIDGLCMREELVVSGLSRGLGEVQIFGGSAGDGTRFQKTFVLIDGEFREDCAVCCLVHTSHPFTVFRTQHFVPSHEKLVVTEADPAQRIVTEINGSPAGPEYARALGLTDIRELTPLVFATHPVVVRVGGKDYVRSIQKVNDDGSLTFFCAIDEGIVLTAAQGVDFVDNLRETFQAVREEVGVPKLVIGCDCVLRHLEIERDGLKPAVSDILRQNNVIGFSTYGEQIEAMHVNQTFTGVAIGVR
ncbi:MAG: FIST C-terminal domain-containing protein [Planctomycetes bacterium]|nr:FIST C-terminal domain-containing protein [Planctomycetota bacterium]MCB9870736.1 FIST C-terminal domain-containing protein [Planctomycetota bacterium]MCB9889071.1 FIST C-terminal domain-containing protein [Planctomycetota bacterium]